MNSGRQTLVITTTAAATAATIIYIARYFWQTFIQSQKK